MRRLGFAVLGVVLAGVVSPAAAASPEMDARAVKALARAIVPKGRDGNGWGYDIHQGLTANGIGTSKENVCSVIAVIGQESGFVANPEVKGLGPMAEKAIREKLAKLPVVPGPAMLAFEWFLAHKPTAEKSYLALIRAARTERDLDLVFRNIAYNLFKDYATTGLLNSSPVAAKVDAANPVTTLGSMQVSVEYVIGEVETAKDRKLRLNEIWALRDELYMRAGGVAYGTRMLLRYYAGYDSRIYVFADYNAGRYASRNAGFQQAVAELSGAKLALDGDLLVYEKGSPKREASGTEKAVRSLKTGLGDKEIRADLLLGKSVKFRETETYRRVAALYQKTRGRDMPKAAIPQITLASPKISHTMTTEKFARSVMGRYERCLGVK